MADRLLNKAPLVAPDHFALRYAEVLFDRFIDPHDIERVVQDEDADICLVDNRRNRLVCLPNGRQLIARSVLIRHRSGNCGSALEFPILKQERKPEITGNTRIVRGLNHQMERFERIPTSLPTGADFFFQLPDIIRSEYQRKILAE